MSSTVTTATVATMSTAVSLADYGRVLTLIVFIVLAALIVAKEVTAYSRTVRVRTLTRGLDIAALPLLVIFALVMAMNSMSFAAES